MLILTNINKVGHGGIENTEDVSSLSSSFVTKLSEWCIFNARLLLDDTIVFLLHPR